MDRVNGLDWIDIGGGRRGFRGRNALAGLLGTEVPALWLNGVQEEVLAILEQAGIVPDAAVYTQLMQALRRGAIEYVTLGGTASALTATFTPANSALRDGQRIWVKVPLKHADGATLNVDGLGPLPILTQRGLAIKRGDLPDTGRCLLVYSADLLAWLIAGVAYSETPVFLTAPLTVYVRPDGSDSNDGSANTALSAFKTIQAAVNYASRLSGNGYTVTAQLAAGTYAPAIVKGLGAPIVIRGDPVTPANAILSGNVASAGILTVQACDAELTGVTVANTSTYGVVATGVANLKLTACRWGDAVSACINSDRNSIITIAGSHTVLAGSHAAWILATAGGTVSADGGAPPTVDTLATANFSNAFVQSSGGYIDWPAGTFTNKTNAVGRRYLCVNGGIITSNGGGVNFYSGTVAGDAANGWYY